MIALAMARRNLDQRLALLRQNDALRAPPKGWIRAIRSALGMTTAQMASRMGVSQPRIIELEQSEAHHTVTLKSLERAAEALGCTLVYALVPVRPLEAQVQDRASEIAKSHMQSVGHSMRLEDQGTPGNTEQGEIRRMTENLLANKPSRLWDS